MNVGLKGFGILNMNVKLVRTVEFIIFKCKWFFCYI